MRRKIICLALAACLACGTLGGCSSGNSELSSEVATSSLSSSQVSTSSAVSKSIDIPKINIDGKAFKITSAEFREYFNNLLPSYKEKIPVFIDIEGEQNLHSVAIDDYMTINVFCEGETDYILMVYFELDKSEREWSSYSAYINTLTTLFDGEAKYSSLSGELGFYDKGDIESHGTSNGDFSIFYSYKVEDQKASFGMIPFQKEAVLESSSPEELTSSASDPTSYPAGMYKIGSDLPAGEYVLIPATSLGGYFSIDKDSTGDLDSIIANDSFDGRSIVTVQDGQYFTVNRCEIYPIESAPAVDTSSGILPEGMYKVGVDLPAGEYKVKPTSSLGGYFGIYSDSSHDFGSILSNDNFDTERYVTVKEGQYLSLSRAELALS